MGHQRIKDTEGQWHSKKGVDELLLDIYDDVKKYIKSCIECQKCATK